jgi:glutaredoxin
MIASILGYTVKNRNVYLYVKSEKVYVTEYTMPHQSGGGHWCSAGYRAQQTLRCLNENEQKAKQLLESAAINYKIIDLGESSFLTKIKAKLKGVNETPTLIFGNRKIEGIENIQNFLTINANKG